MSSTRRTTAAVPFAEWFDSLDTQAALKVRSAIAQMEAGNFGDAKPVGEGVLSGESIEDQDIEFTPAVSATSWSFFSAGEHEAPEK